jgi:hypothetical protein
MLISKTAISNTAFPHNNMMYQTPTLAKPKVMLVALLISTLVATLGTSCRDDISPGAAEQGLTKATVGSVQDKESTEEPKANDEFFYSPFVVKLEGGPFDTVSFKDVGLKRESKDPDDPLLEILSESLVYEFSQQDALDYEARVVYDPKILDVSNHLYCGANHLYIDVWHSSSPDRWGFSLWSGCSDIDNFAWIEVPDTRSAADLTLHVEPLTAGIVNELAKAAASNCFQKTC